LDLNINSAYTGNIGSSGGYLLIDVTSGLGFSSGGSNTFINGTIGTVYVSDGVADADMLHLDGTITMVTCTGGSGTVTIAVGADCARVRMQAAYWITVDIEANVTSLAQLLVDAGNATCASSCTSTLSRGGSTTVSGSATVGTLTQESNSVVVYNSSGTITTLDGYGGFFDGRANPATSVAITNCTSHAGHKMDLQSGLRNFTFTNPAEIRGGIVIPDVGQTITIA
jgi:hypothetical protein